MLAGFFTGLKFLSQLVFFSSNTVPGPAFLNLYLKTFFRPYSILGLSLLALLLVAMTLFVVLLMLLALIGIVLVSLIMALSLVMVPVSFLLPS